jgi:hypothetical protein
VASSLVLVRNDFGAHQQRFGWARIISPYNFRNPGLHLRHRKKEHLMNGSDAPHRPIDRGRPRRSDGAGHDRRRRQDGSNNGRDDGINSARANRAMQGSGPTRLETNDLAFRSRREARMFATHPAPPCGRLPRDMHDVANESKRDGSVCVFPPF